MTGDVDGDGTPEMVLTSRWSQALRIISTRSQQTGSVKFNAGEIKAEFQIAGNESLFRSILFFVNHRHRTHS